MAEKKEMRYGADARKELLRGIDALCNAVKSTLGPKGRYAVYRDVTGKAHATKDGVTIAREVQVFDPVESVGADMVREAANKAANDSGDGTTTATVLAQAMVHEGVRLIDAGINPVDITRGMDKAAEQVFKYLDDNAVPVNEDTLIKVATISANGDEGIAKLVKEAFDKVGAKGSVTTELAKDGVTKTTLTQGVRINTGFANKYFMTDMSKKEAVLNNPYVLLYDDKIDSFTKELLPPLDELFGVDPTAEVLVVASDFDQEVLATLLANKLKNGMKLSAIKIPNQGELKDEVIADISAATGAYIISKRAGDKLSEVTVDAFGRAGKVISGYYETLIVEGKGEFLFEHVEALQNLKNDPHLEERIALLTGGVAVIEVGGATDVEMKEKKDRVDDAIGAVKSAIAEGVVVGGGTTLVRASETIKIGDSESDEAFGVRLVKKACLAPLKTIAENAGNSGDNAVFMVSNFCVDEVAGYDANRGQIVNMFDHGILDPKKVTRVAFESALSVAKVILTTDCAMGSYE